MSSDVRCVVLVFEHFNDLKDLSIGYSFILIEQFFDLLFVRSNDIPRQKFHYTCVFLQMFTIDCTLLTKWLTSSPKTLSFLFFSNFGFLPNFYFQTNKFSLYCIIIDRCSSGNHLRISIEPKKSSQTNKFLLLLILTPQLFFQIKNPGIEYYLIQEPSSTLRKGFCCVSLSSHKQFSE